MKKALLLSSLFVSLLFSSCFETSDEELYTLEIITDPQLLTADSSTGFEYSDQSGTIHTKIFYATSDATSHNYVSFSIPEDYVVVGGGAELIEEQSDDKNSAFLISSYPSLDLSAWNVESVNYLSPEATHKIAVYAIGMKIDGFTSDELKEYVDVSRSAWSVEMSNPNTYQSAGSNHYLIGGGAELDVTRMKTGSFLTESYPFGSRWKVAGIDHTVSDPCRIRSYAIYINNTIPGYGELESNWLEGSDYSSKFYEGIATSQSVSEGWVMTCPGAKSEYNAEGRLLKSLFLNETNQSTIAVTRDFGGSNGADSGTLTAYACRIWKKL